MIHIYYVTVAPYPKVVQRVTKPKVDNAIHWINQYPVDSVIHWFTKTPALGPVVQYPSDKTLSSG